MKTLLLLPILLIALTANGQTKKIEYESFKKLTKAYDGLYWETWDVVMRPINPLKDDYKAFCRYIISDIVKQKGAALHGLSITIYDNEKAYLDDNKHDFTKQDLLFADKHRVCMYSGKMPDDAISEYKLHFFDGMGKGYKYKGQETYNP